MESKRPVSRFKDPFAVDPLPKAYYHPSPKKKLSKKQKLTSIEAQGGNVEADESRVDEAMQKLSPEDEMFLKGANIYQSKHTNQEPDEEGADFDETWPSSERPSSVSLIGFEEDAALDRYRSALGRAGSRKEASETADLTGRLTMPGLSAQRMAGTSSGRQVKSRIPVLNGKKNTQENTEIDDDGSVLKRYVDRFRNSEPMSREEREQASKSMADSFWWLKEGKPQGREKKNRDSDSERSELTRQTMERYDQWKGVPVQQKSRAYIPESPGDKTTIELQERAERLLEKSSSTVLSTEPAVSTEGLGSTLSDMSSIDEYSYRPKFASYLEPRVNPPQYVAPMLPGQRPPPEDDPLYQWRLRRRMEVAQQAAPKQSPQFDFLSKTEQQKKIDSKLEEFKQRLAGKVPSKDQVHFTPAPLQPQVSAPSENKGVYDPPVASPSLHPPRNKPFEEVDPHLHLMCDLLPCPHRGRYQPADDQGSSGQGRKGEDSKKQYDKGENSTSEDIKTSVYRQYLEAEKPDAEQITSVAYKARTEMKVKNGPASHKRTEQVDDIYGEKKSIEEIERMVRNVGLKETDQDSDYKKGDKERELRKKSQTRTEKNQKSFDEKSSGNDESDILQCNVSKQTQKQSHKGAEQTGERQQVERNVVRPQQEKVLKPQHSSSPKNGRKTVNAAIGQVIKEHLFSTSTSMVLSSVESLPPSASAERLPWKQKHHLEEHSHDQALKAAEEEDVPYESDGEFPDDRLLQMLRRQRAQYEHQLHEIDHMLDKLGNR